jgi:hypothetical protein
LKKYIDIAKADLVFVSHRLEKGKAEADLTVVS